MRFTIAAAAFAGLAAAQGPWGNWPAGNATSVSYTTEVLTAYTTYCPSATVITHGPSKYTVTEATTLTITNCPCTVTKPVTLPPKATGTAPWSPWKGPGTSAPPAPTTTKPAVTSPIVPVGSNAAGKYQVGVAGVLAVAGLVAAL